MANTGMRVRIHRGAREIGGTCIEVEAAGKRLALDVGLPIGAEASAALLPKVPGFREPDDSLLAVVISHPHQDHYGLAQYLRPDLPVVLGEAAHRILQAASAFTPAGASFTHVLYLKNRQPITLGPFEITPYLVDHSAYDAYALLISAGGQRIFYSGDIRGHGRKARLFEQLVRHPPQDVDVLLMEGTTVGRAQATDQFRTEQDLELAFIKQMTATSGLSLIWSSGQNIDRLVTIFKACRRAKRQLIIDLYTAEILRATGNPHVPQGAWDQVRVYLPDSQRRQVKQQARFEVVERYRRQRIFPAELAKKAGRSALFFRPSMVHDLEHAHCLQGARLIYSLWEGYLRQDRMRPFLDWLRRHHIPLTHIHTSGHASVADLQRLAAAIHAKRLVPIHSDQPKQFAELFDHVEMRADGDWWEV